MLVVDTSAVVAALVGRPTDDRLVGRLGADGDLHAPHLLDVELLHVLRRMVTTGRLTEDRAADARADLADLVIVRYRTRRWPTASGRSATS
jgi:predicted nucleic acid-binding protein